MAADRLRKAQHTVPRALLAGFSIDGKVLTRRRDGREFRETINRASVATHFYSVEDESGSKDDAVERWLASDIEDGFHALLPDLVRGQQPPKGSGQTVARYVAALATRSRATEAMQLDTTPALGGLSVLLTMADNSGINLADLARGDLVALRAECEQFFLKWFGPPSKASLLRTALWVFDQTAPRLRHYVWRVLLTETDLLLGDHPVVSISREETRFAGLLPQGCTAFLPLAPRTLLIGEPPLFRRPALDNRWLPLLVNQLTARDCHSNVYRRPGTPWPTNVTLTPSRTPLTQQNWSVTRSTETEEQAAASERGLSRLSDPAAQQLMERLRTHQDRHVEEIAERLTDLILPSVYGAR